jgi:ADP-ribosylglycohydrolase
MKSVLIIAASLMTAASVYGIIDYNKKSNSKEFKQLYTQEQPALKDEEEVITEEKKPAVVESANAEKNKTVVGKKPAVKKPVKKKKKHSKFSTKAFSRSRLG